VREFQLKRRADYRSSPAPVVKPSPDATPPADAPAEPASDTPAPQSPH
jgi:UPF0755 protein